MASGYDSASQRLIEIAEYHNDVVDAVSTFLKSLFRDSDMRFLGYSSSEFNTLVRERIEETELRSSLAVLAMLEAAFRIDYQLRVKKRFKDSLSRELRAIYKRKQDRARFDEDLLELWVQHYPSLKSLIGDLRSWVHFRHWLAHGRYWRRPAHRRFDYQALFLLADAIVSQFPFHES